MTSTPSLRQARNVPAVSPSVPAPQLRRSLLQRIAVASDGSPPAEVAFDLALQLARTAGSSLKIISVIPAYPELDFGSFAGAPPNIPDAGTERYYQQVASDLKARAETRGVRHVGAETLEGHPGALILAAASAWGADLLVLGARGVTGAHRVLLGSVSNHVAVGSSGSVLVVREGPSSTPPPGGLVFDDVVAGLDGSTGSNFALELAIELSADLGLPLRILSVVPRVHGVRSDPRLAREKRLLEHAEGLVDRARQRATKGNVPNATAEVLRGDPAEAILDYLGESQRHLLVVGSRGGSDVHPHLLGSVSTALLHHAPSSVLIARAPRVIGPRATPTTK